ncbi:hypothetical protein [Ideonella sp.]|uniref:hypothetical protein n=1 Tax=Ideonella sp. TaxID=1929293 RepID=UPI0035B34DAF
MPPADTGWRPRAGRRTLGVVLLLHVLLVAGLWQAMRWRSVWVTHDRPAVLLWVQPQAVPRPAVVDVTGPAAERPRLAMPPPTPPAPPPAPRPPAAQWVVPLPAPAPPLAAVAAAPPASAASQPPTERLMDSEATRAAIRLAGRQPLLHERAADATGMAPARTDTAMAQGVAASTKGDCMKDAVPGGLLGLPLLAAKVATGNCSK